MDFFPQMKTLTYNIIMQNYFRICQKIITQLSISDICNICRVSRIGRCMMKVLTSFTGNNRQMQSMFRNAFKGRTFYVCSVAEFIMRDNRFSVNRKKKLILFLKKNGDLNWHYLIEIACQQKDRDFMGFLIAESASIDWEYPLRAACDAGIFFVDIVLCHMQFDKYAIKNDFIISRAGSNPELFEYIVKRLKMLRSNLTIRYSLDVTCQTKKLDVVKSIIEISKKYQLPIKWDYGMRVAYAYKSRDVLEFLQNISGETFNHTLKDEPVEEEINHTSEDESTEEPCKIL